MIPDPIAVEVRELTRQHLIVVDGRVREITHLAPDHTQVTHTADRIAYIAALATDQPTDAERLPLDPSGLIPCVRRADWQVPS